MLWKESLGAYFTGHCMSRNSNSLFLQFHRVLKARWQLLQIATSETCELKTLCAWACCILHNLMVDDSEYINVPADELPNDEHDGVVAAVNAHEITADELAAGKTRREEVAQFLWTYMR